MKINQTAKRLNTSKAEIIRNSLEKYFSYIVTDKKNVIYETYCKLERNIPGSDHGLLSLNHREEVGKRIKNRAG